MYNSENEVIFPAKAIPQLKGLRGPLWDNLVDEILTKDPESLEQLAFVMTVVRIVGCSGCNSDSFRAMRGCARCAQQGIKRFRGSDDDLVNLYEKAKKDVSAFLNKQ
ncbi:MAG: hypothetical protein CL609_18865 [Anaerolineaceae bacterium]|nr:hypothetical protein [Anaerolineaceae bacterium]